MILKQSEIVNTIQGDKFGKSVETKINPEKLQKLYSILSGLYKDIFGSIVRELCSNMWDAHKQAGKEDVPIFVIVDCDTVAPKIIFKDSGTGMSPEIMETIFFNYLDSTKEDTNDVIGGFGIGSKSPLAYTHTFYIDTISDGILYHYIFTKQANGIPAGELLFEEQAPAGTTNGTTITVPIKSTSDLSDFKKAIDRQLVYFPNVYVQYLNNYGYSFNNDYIIYDLDTFLYRPDLQSTKEMHMCIGNVYYPIDWNEINMKPVYIPVALKFEIGELTPTPSRENIEYNKTSIPKIIDRINGVIELLVDTYNSTIQTITTFAEYRKINRSKNSSLITINLDKVDISVERNQLPGVKVAKLTTAVDAIVPAKRLYDFCGLDWRLYGSKLHASSGKTTKNTYSIYHNNHTDMTWYDYRVIVDMVNDSCIWGSSLMHSPDDYYILEGELDKEKNKYISETSTSSDYYIEFLKKAKPSLKIYIATILKGVSKQHWREVIKEFQRLQDEFYYTTCKKVYDKIVVDAKWKADKLAERKKLKDEARLNRFENKKIIYYTYTPGAQTAYVLEKQERTVDELSKQHKLIIYTHLDNKTQAYLLNILLKEKSYKIVVPYAKKKGDTFCVIQTTERNHKYFKDYKNMIEINEFLQSNHPLLIKIATAVKMANILKPERLSMLYLTRPLIETLSPEIYTLATEINDYLAANFNNWDSYKFIHILDELVKLVESVDGIDDSMLQKTQLLLDYCAKIDKIKRGLNIDVFEKFHQPARWDLYVYLTILFKHEGLPVTREMSLKPEFNPIYQMCHKDD